MKRENLSQLFDSIKDELFLNNMDKRNNLINLLEGSRFEKIDEKMKILIFSVSSEFVKNVLDSDEFKDEIKNISRRVLNSTYYDISFVLKSEWKKDNKMLYKILPKKNDFLISKFTLDNFLVSKKSKNYILKQAANSISLNPVGEWNPFFIYGASGLGKTHLLHAIGNKTKEIFPHKKIKYLESKNFIDLVYDTEKINTKKIRDINSEFTSYDVLLVDDIQMLQSMPKAKEVFFGILSNYINEEKQIIITSDQYVEELTEFEERFKTRFNGGLVLSVTPPDVETAKKIFIQKINSKNAFVNMKLTDGALDFIATNFSTNVRELEGALAKIVFWTISSESKKIYDVNDMIKIFDNFNDKNSKELTIQNIIKIVGKYYQINTVDILGKSRKSNIVLPRHLSIYFTRKILKYSLLDIGKYFGRDHSTILSSINKIEKDSSKNQELSKVIYELRKKIISN